MKLEIHKEEILMEQRWLEPRYDGAQSFYKKAYVKLGGGEIKLYSYDTLIVTYNPNTEELSFTRYWDYSQTTLRHLKDFLGQYTKLSGHLSKKEIYALTKEGREEIAFKEEQKALREAERLERQATKKEERRILAELRAAEKAKLKEAFTKEFEGILSKSEINKIVMTELNA